MTPDRKSPTALVTGGSRGLGLALVRELSRRGWHVVVDARDGDRLDHAVADLPGVRAIAGDVVDNAHRAILAEAVAGGLDLLVNNASTIGPSPMVGLADHPLPELLEVFEVNALAPIALAQLALPALRLRAGRIVDVSSDAAVEAYPTWGAYGAAKAALDHASAVLAVEHPDLRVYAFDPGDMGTELHRLADPDANLSGLPTPESVVPALLRLVDEDMPSGRYRIADLTAARTASGTPRESDLVFGVTG